LAKDTGQNKREAGERLLALLQEFGVEALMGGAVSAGRQTRSGLIGRPAGLFK
jgi:hypothetical protein